MTTLATDDPHVALRAALAAFDEEAAGPDNREVEAWLRDVVVPRRADHDARDRVGGAPVADVRERLMRRTGPAGT